MEKHYQFHGTIDSIISEGQLRVLINNFRIPEGLYVVGQSRWEGYNHLVVFTSREWLYLSNSSSSKEFVASITNISFLETTIGQDGRNTLTLPLPFLNYLGLSNNSEAYVRGFGTYFEIWNKNDLNEYFIRYLKHISAEEELMIEYYEAML